MKFRFHSLDWDQTYESSQHYYHVKINSVWIGYSFLFSCQGSCLQVSRNSGKPCSSYIQEKVSWTWWNWVHRCIWQGKMAWCTTSRPADTLLQGLEIPSASWKWSQPACHWPFNNSRRGMVSVGGRGSIFIYATVLQPLCLTILFVIQQEKEIRRFAGTVPNMTTTGDLESMGMYAGQGVGLIKEIPSAGEVIKRLVDGAQLIIQQNFE